MALTGSIPVTGSLIVNDVSPRREKKFLRFGGFFFVKKLAGENLFSYLCCALDTLCSTIKKNCSHGKKLD